MRINDIFNIRNVGIAALAASIASCATTQATPTPAGSVRLYFADQEAVATAQYRQNCRHEVIDCTITDVDNQNRATKCVKTICDNDQYVSVRPVGRADPESVIYSIKAFEFKRNHQSGNLELQTQ